MKKLALLALLLVGCATPIRNAPPPPTPLQVACEYVEASYPSACEGLAEPIYVRSWIVDDHILSVVGNLRGLHYGKEPYVFVRPDLSPRDTRRVLIHETVHYIVSHAEIELTRCENEEFARQVDNAWAGEEYNDNWKVWYACTDEADNAD